MAWIRGCWQWHQPALREAPEQVLGALCLECSLLLISLQNYTKTRLVAALSSSRSLPYRALGHSRPDLWQQTAYG